MRCSAVAYLEHCSRDRYRVLCSTAVVTVGNLLRSLKPQFPDAVIVMFISFQCSTGVVELYTVQRKLQFRAVVGIFWIYALCSKNKI